MSTSSQKMSALPVELHQEILVMLSPHDLARLSATSATFHEIVRSNLTSVAQHLCQVEQVRVSRYVRYHINWPTDGTIDLLGAYRRHLTHRRDGSIHQGILDFAMHWMHRQLGIDMSARWTLERYATAAGDTFCAIIAAVIAFSTHSSRYQYGSDTPEEFTACFACSLLDTNQAQVRTWYDDICASPWPYVYFNYPPVAQARVRSLTSYSHNYSSSERFLTAQSHSHSSPEDSGLYSMKAVAKLLEVPEMGPTYRYCVTEKWAGLEVGKAIEKGGPMEMLIKAAVLRELYVY